MKRYPSATTSTISCVHVTITCKRSVIFAAICQLTLLVQSGSALWAAALTIVMLCCAGSGLQNKLQRVQNNLARIVRDIRRGERPSHELLPELHWLPVASRVNFKISLLCYKSLRHGQPNCIRTLLTYYVPPRRLSLSSFVGP
jgi:hypothetical protein